MTVTNTAAYIIFYVIILILSIGARWSYHTPKEEQTKEKLLRIIVENNLWFAFLITFILKSIYKFWRDLPDN